jgi:large subunit ribosomal protein L10
MTQKIGRIFRQTQEGQIQKRLEEASGFFVINYAGLSASALNRLRQSLFSCGARLLVVKNSIARRLLEQKHLKEACDLLKGPCGLVFIKDDPVATSKALCGFGKEHENLDLAGGALEQRVLKKEDILALSAIPSKEILYAKAVMAIKAPITNLVLVYSGILKKILYALEQIKTEKQKKQKT